MSVTRVLRATGVLAAALLVHACSDSGSPADEGGTGNIAGQVVNPLEGNAGLGGINVRIQSTAGGSNSASTNLAGGFTFVGVATGNWTVSVEVPGGMRLAPSETGSRIVNLKRGETVNTQAFELVPLAQQVGSIVGRVTAGGVGVSGATITMLNDTQNPPTTSSDASGNFGFSNLTAGLYTLRITPPAGYQLATGQTQERTATVVAGSTVTVDWALQAASIVGGSFSP